MTSLPTVMVPSSGKEDASVNTIESDMSVMSPFRVVVADEKSAAEVSTMLDVDVGLEIAPFKVVAAPPNT